MRYVRSLFLILIVLLMVGQGFAQDDSPLPTFVQVPVDFTCAPRDTPSFYFQYVPPPGVTDPMGAFARLTNPAVGVIVSVSNDHTRYEGFVEIQCLGIGTTTVELMVFKIGDFDFQDVSRARIATFNLTVSDPQTPTPQPSQGIPVAPAPLFVDRWTQAGYPQASCIAGEVTTLSLSYIPGSTAEIEAAAESRTPDIVTIPQVLVDPSIQQVHVTLNCPVNGIGDVSVYIANPGEMTPDHRYSTELRLAIYSNNRSPDTSPTATHTPDWTNNPPAKECATPFFEPAQNWTDRCAVAPAITVPAAYQLFDYGHMVWRGDIGMIYVLYDTSKRGFTQPLFAAFREDSLTDGPILTVEATYQPQDVFAKLWSQDDFVRERLGGAAGPMLNYDMQLQIFRGDPLASAFNLPGETFAYAFTGDNNWFGIGYVFNLDQGRIVPQTDPRPAEAVETAIQQPSSDISEPRWVAVNGTYQAFEGGEMIWTPSTGVIVIFNDGTWTRATWQDYEFIPIEAPPAGYYIPYAAHAMGKVWSQNPEIQAKLGWALDLETGMTFYRRFPFNTSLNSAYYYVDWRLPDARDEVRRLQSPEGVWGVLTVD